MRLIVHARRHEGNLPFVEIDFSLLRGEHLLARAHGTECLVRSLKEILLHFLPLFLVRLGHVLAARELHLRGVEGRLVAHRHIAAALKDLHENRLRLLENFQRFLDILRLGLLAFLRLHEFGSAGKKRPPAGEHSIPIERRVLLTEILDGLIAFERLIVLADLHQQRCAEEVSVVEITRFREHAQEVLVLCNSLLENLVLRLLLRLGFRRHFHALQCDRLRDEQLRSLFAGSLDLRVRENLLQVAYWGVVIAFENVADSELELRIKRARRQHLVFLKKLLKRLHRLLGLLLIHQGTGCIEILRIPGSHGCRRRGKLRICRVDESTNRTGEDEAGGDD